ncbi:Cytochrome B subunit of succinate dehydrogenase [Mycena indigotica]|uniref:Cytochrome B subunit of succinate dehydrogenase n=1 Tax=Mycena indigotica TaxID=2126181 RepID=A0A8H6VZ86_9AGAR|nr:Cytochrome B subunit of succinate dehydrogenase [Mycena indigotica]KAF7299222.1 Cytochrome B subunit of succinate dehydrogenase [Mycena indigotica]
MLSTRAVGLSSPLRQAILGRALVRSPVALAKRSVQTESLPPSAAVDILNQQRLRRPSSPHFTIYQPQMTWIPSIFHRATGGALSALLYAFSLAYVVAPGTFDSAHVVEFVAGMPDAVKYAGKTLLAAPLLFHSFNGVRHLGWDMLKFMNVKGMYQTGYTVLAATAIGTVGLVLM